MASKYKSPALEVLHKSMVGLHEIGLLPDEKMRKFDLSCLKPGVIKRKISGEKPSKAE